MVRLDKDVVKSEAKKLRAKGCTYSQITTQLGVPKSTLNNWFRGLPPSPHQDPKAYSLRIKNIQQMGARANQVKKEERVVELQRDVATHLKSFPYGDVNVLGGLLAMLYWAEGTKGSASGLVFANTDPQLALLFITLLRKCFPIDESRVRIRLHLHHYHNENDAKRYWSDLLQVPEEQFGKIYWKERSKTKKFRQNFQGICFIIYNDVAFKRRILFTAQEIGNHINLRP